MKAQTIINKINPFVSKSMLKKDGTNAFISKYSKMDVSDVDWIDVCNDVEAYGCYKYGFIFMLQLLKDGLYIGNYAVRLLSNLPIYEKMTHQRTKYIIDVMCGDRIEQQVLYASKKPFSIWFSSVFIDTKNLFIPNIMAEYLHTVKSKNLWFIREVADIFGKSLGKYENEIHSATDFNGTMLFTQTDFYLNYFKEDADMRHAALYFVINFYRWLVKSNPDHNYFENEFHMSDKLLFHNRLPELINRNFYFTTLNPNNIPYGKDKVCFILKGFDSFSTTITNDDFVTFDFSGLSNVFYRNLLIEYVVTDYSASTIKWIGIPIYIREGMESLYQVKQNMFYPNKRLNYLTNQEAVFIRKIFDSQEISITTKNNKIGAVRRFIAFCVDKKAIEVDELFFDYLIQYEEPNKSTAKAVPDKELGQLSKYLLEQSKDNLFYKEIFVIFHLAIQTEFRINQICHLHVDCIKPTIKPNQFEVLSNSKTSHGKKNRYVISNMTYNLLMDIIESTESIRDKCPIDSMKQYIFIYNQSSSYNRPVVFNHGIFSRKLGLACESIGIERFTASNLRDTHMTKSLEHIMRNGKSDLEMSVLSKHKHMDTTKNHYIEIELEKMLESTYGIIIGTELIHTDSKVVDDIPEGFASEENDVENGCGKCTADTCVMTSSLPCLACKYFITTPKHEIYFKKAIEDVYQLIKSTSNRHDIEDLVTIKKLYVLYLKAIIKHKEKLKNDN